MEPRIAELLVRGGIVSRDQLTEAQEKGVIAVLAFLGSWSGWVYQRRHSYGVSC
jgi:hypothetical protein